MHLPERFPFAATTEMDKPLTLEGSGERYVPVLRHHRLDFSWRGNEQPFLEVRELQVGIERVIFEISAQRFVLFHVQALKRGFGLEELFALLLKGARVLIRGLALRGDGPLLGQSGGVERCVGR